MLHGLTREVSTASLYLLHSWKEVTRGGWGEVLPEVLMLGQGVPSLTLS